MRTRFLLLLPAVLMAGCAVGSNYKRPQVAPPPEFRNAPAGAAGAASLADTKWSELFQDDVLKQLIATALKQNFDLEIASERVEEARARFRITGADQYPVLNAAGQMTATRTSLVGANRLSPNALTDTSYAQAGGALSWELDLWGQLRRMTESARAQYLATEEARRGVIVSLIAEVANNYFYLRERDLELEIARGTRDIAQHNLDLVKLRHDHGAATGLDVHQAEEFLYTATAQIASAQRDIGQAENALSLLIGEAPTDIPRGKAVDDFGLPPEVPAGLPSSLLERRPDIRQAEQNLIAANAQIGVAKSYYFPQISLTGFLGGQSRALTNLFTGPARFWTGTPSAVLPIFNAGAVKVGVKLTEAQKREMIAAYRKSIYNGFKEVSDALVAYSRTREQRLQQDQLVHALMETDRLSNLRYQGGLDSYLQVLDAERSLFQGRLVLAQLRLQELESFVGLYKALGGGWQ